MKRNLLSVLTACGLMSAHADLFQYTVTFSSAGESLPSTGTGSGAVNYDSTTHSLQLQANFSGLQGNTTASHIHAPTAVAGTGNAGVATTTPSFALFPLGVSSGTYADTLDLTSATSWNPAFVTANGSISGAESALATAMASGKAYWNIHSTYNAGGEIRGFLVAVPEPSSLALAGLGFVGMAAGAWNRCRAHKS
jgi:hypothetical protein